MIFDYKPDDQGNFGDAFKTNILQANIGTIVYLEVDNVYCKNKVSIDTEEQCYGDVTGYAEYLSAVMGNSKETSDAWGIVQIGSLKDEASSDGKDSYGIAIGLVIIALIVVTVGVIVQTQKKRAKGVTWFPDGFFPTASQPMKRKAENQEMFGFGSRMPSITNMDGWSDDDPLEHPTKKVRRGEFSSGQTMVTDADDNDDGRCQISFKSVCPNFGIYG
jgi:Notch-like protein